jgi:hypothetical protein
MAKDSDPLAGTFETKESGLLSGLLAEESEFDRRMMWRLGSWGAVAVGAVVIAVMANQAQLGWRRDQVAAADLVRQAERLQTLSKESQNEARKLASAIDTLNSDRDRLYTRVTVLEQGLDSVTGAIKQNAAPSQPAAAAQPAPQGPAPAVAPVASTPAPDKPRLEAAREQPKDQLKEPPRLPPQSAAAASLVPLSPAVQPTLPLVPQKSIMAPPDPAASKLVQPEKTDQADNKAAKTEKTAAKPKTDPAKTDLAKTDQAKVDQAKVDQAKPDAAKIEAAPIAPAQPTEVAAAPAAASPESAEPAPPPIPVQQTRFAIDLGSASSIGGLRALWQGVIKSNPEIAALRPIIMVKEGKTGLGMQLRLGAGPLVNAAVAAKLCAGLVENERACETTVFDGQRLSMRGGQDAAPQEPAKDAATKDAAAKDTPPKAETPAPPPAKPERHRRSYSSSKRSKHEEPAPPPAPAAPPKQESASSTLSSFFNRNRN